MSLANGPAFTTCLAPLQKTKWFVYSKRPFAGPQAILVYLSRYTHRIAIANSRLIALDDKRVIFRWKGLPRRRPRPIEDDDARVSESTPTARAPSRGFVP